jgi:hypothetical protein
VRQIPVHKYDVQQKLNAFIRLTEKGYTLTAKRIEYNGETVFEGVSYRAVAEYIDAETARYFQNIDALTDAAVSIIKPDQHSGLVFFPVNKLRNALRRAVNAFHDMREDIDNVWTIEKRGESIHLITAYGDDFQLDN